MTKEQIIAAGQTLKNLAPSGRHPVGEYLLRNAEFFADPFEYVSSREGASLSPDEAVGFGVALQALEDIQ